MKMTVWFEKILLETEPGVKNNIYLQRHSLDSTFTNVIQNE